MNNVVADLLRWILRLGAIIVLLDVAVDPFSQQLVQLRQDLVYNEDHEAVISRAERYSKGSWFRDSTLTLDPCKPLVRSLDYTHSSNADSD
jgi:hypothetical protein